MDSCLYYIRLSVNSKEKIKKEVFFLLRLNFSLKQKGLLDNNI